MHTAEIELVLGLLAVVAALGGLARRLGVPYAIVLFLAGLFLGLIPGLPSVALAPEVVFLLFLPPLVYIAGFFTSVRDFRAQARPILSLAVGLVLVTTVAVAAVVHALMPEIGWPTAFTLGAIVSPTDAIAAVAILQRPGVPRRVVTVLEGESVLNDATGLVAYRFAVAAVLTGSFSLSEALPRLVVVGVGGVALGVVLGWVVGRVRTRLSYPPVEITISLLTPYVAYLPAEALGVSGVLATVTCGMLLGRQAPRIMEADTRVQSGAVWETLAFLFNGLVFLLMGLQLRLVIENTQVRSVSQLVILAVLVSLVVIVVRFAWIFGSDLPRLVRRRGAGSWQTNLVSSWAGMRGVVSLAAALALPLTTASGDPFPQRHLLIFLTMCVILSTLVGQGLTLRLMLSFLRLRGDGMDLHEEAIAREAAGQAAELRLGQLADAWPDHQPLIDALRAQYLHRASHLASHSHDADGHDAPPSDATQQEIREHRAIRHAVIEAGRSALLDLRDSGQIGDEVLRTVERELDLEELRMEA